MKKIFTSVLLTFILFNFSFADKVDDEKARKVAIAHLSQVQDFVGSINLDLAQIYNTTIQSAFNPNEFENTPLLYIYNIGDNNGIILVSGDDVASPILGYTMSGSFDINNLPYNFKNGLKVTKVK